MKLSLSKAFTLLELLVVIGIISVLLSLGAITYSTAQKKARDAKRKGDLQSMQKFLEQCYSINSYAYPSDDDAPSHLTGNGTITITATCVPDGSSTLTITDPTTQVFTVASTTSTYTISKNLEDGVTPISISNQQ